MTPDIILQRTGIDVRAVEQGDDAWHKLRLGVITASEVQRLSVSGIQELSLLRPVSVLTMRECRGEISGNRAAISRHPMFCPGQSA